MMRLMWKGAPGSVKVPDFLRKRARVGRHVGVPSVCGCQEGSTRSGIFSWRRGHCGAYAPGDPSGSILA